MSQTDKLFAAVLVAFVIYITVRGQLPSYGSLFVPARNTQQTTGNPVGDFIDNGVTAGQQLDNIVSGQAVGHVLGLPGMSGVNAAGLASAIVEGTMFSDFTAFGGP